MAVDGQTAGAQAALARRRSMSTAEAAATAVKPAITSRPDQP